MAHTIFHIVQYKQLTEELQRQLDTLPSHNDECLTELELLDAVIHVSLRLDPAVPSVSNALPLQRVSLSVSHTYQAIHLSRLHFTLFSEAST